MTSSPEWQWHVPAAARSQLEGLGLAPDRLAVDSWRMLRPRPGRQLLTWESRDGTCLYLRREKRPAGRSAAEQEAQVLERLAHLGHRVAAALAIGTQTNGESCLLWEALPGQPLDTALAVQPLGERRRQAEEVGRTLARWHQSGTHGQLFAWHLLTDPAGVALLDVGSARLTGRRGARLAARCRDLGALWATVPWYLLGGKERVAMLRAYGWNRRQLRRLLPWVQRASLHWHRKGALPRDRSLVEVWPAGDHILTRPELAAAPTADWFASPDIRLVRERDGRRNLRWPRPRSGEPCWFGKHYGPARSAVAWREWQNHARLDWLGLPGPELAALVEKAGGESVLWTRGIEPGFTLRDALHTLAPQQWRRGRRWLGEVAEVVRRLHDGGCCHRDLYLDHFLASGSGEQLTWKLIDLARMEEHLRVPLRRRVRDLASLEFSARTAAVPRTERWRALRRYSRGRVDRRLARAVVRKADLIQHREERHGRFPVERPCGSA